MKNYFYNKNQRRGAQLLLFALSSMYLISALARQEILPPEAVFQYEANVKNNLIFINWDIKEGYYLYKDRMSYALNSNSAALGIPNYPDGETHSDEFFGEQIIFRDEVSISIPILNNSNRGQKTELIVQSQGCADYGLCYPPQEWLIPNKLEPKLLSPIPKKGIINNLLNTKFDNPIPISEAFVPSIKSIDPFTLEIRWEIAPGYYLYKENFSASNPENQVQLGKLILPNGSIIDDLEYGETEVYFNSVVLRLPISRSTPNLQKINIQIDYQGCKEDSICYPPESANLAITLPEATLQPSENFDLPISEQKRLFGVIANSTIATIMFIFLGLGLLLAFTPCCLPMVPILSSIIAGQGEKITAIRSFWLSLSYVLGMSLTYTIAGALFGAAGQQIQAVLQTPIIIFATSALFVILSMAMFGVFELQLPASWQSRLLVLGKGSKAGSFAGTALMGSISALVVATCVAPPLVAALAVIAQTGDIIRGALALFALSIGMGIPLLIYGTTAGKLLPQSGQWMNSIKSIFGFMLLGLSIWMLSRILSDFISMSLWALLFISGGIWLGAFDKFDRTLGRRKTLTKVSGILITIYGAILVAGAISGSRNLLNPLDRIINQESNLSAKLTFEGIKSINDFENLRRLASASEKPIMLDFYADWCISCKEMEYFTFTNPNVQEILKEMVLIKADVTANDKIDQELLKYFGIFGPPTIIFFDRNGFEIEAQRVIGYQDAESFIKTLKYITR
ncbi:MAG: protein-disulfide reductase DsbD [Pseudomonadota bacterium]|nr:protein-disulfide reductase DsbD [Pseudomonadota bacterium]